MIDRHTWKIRCFITLVQQRPVIFLWLKFTIDHDFQSHYYKQFGCAIHVVILCQTTVRADEPRLSADCRLVVVNVYWLEENW